MKYLFVINTEAQIHTWRNLIAVLESRGNDVKVVVRDYHDALSLAANYGFDCFPFPFVKRMRLLTHVRAILQAGRAFRPEMVIGFGIDAALAAKLLKKVSVIFIDDDPTVYQNKACGLLASAIITPACFRSNLGPRHLRVQSYKELAYLHPTRFTPDPSVFKELGIVPDERYIIIRFNAFDALHDRGRQGFSLVDKYRLIKQLEHVARIFISSETPLPPEFEKYQLHIPKHRIHHALYFAQLLVADTGTMATEAAILGVPAIRSGLFGATHTITNFVELQQKYGLIYSLQESEKVIQQAIELAKQPGLKDLWRAKRDRLLAEKIDFTDFMVDFIEKWPTSFALLQAEKKLTCR